MTKHSHKHGKKDSNSGHAHTGHSHNHGGKRRIRVGVKPGKTIGAVYTECNIHDGAIVVSGSLTVETGATGIGGHIAEGLEKAAGEIAERGGVVGHIKTAVSTLSTSMISVTDDKAMIKEPPAQRVSITLAAIVFLVEPEEAEAILRTALAGIRARLRQEYLNL